MRPEEGRYPPHEQKGPPTIDEFLGGVFDASVGSLRRERRITGGITFILGTELKHPKPTLEVERGFLLRSRKEDYAIVQGMTTSGPWRERYLLVGRKALTGIDRVIEQRAEEILSQGIDSGRVAILHSSQGKIVAECSRDLLLVLENGASSLDLLTWSGYINAIDVAARVLGF